NLAASYRTIGHLIGDELPLDSTIRVSSLSAGNLTLKPQYGGATLASTSTFLPVGFDGNAANLARLLTADAGGADLNLGGQQRRSEVDSNPSVNSAIVNVRHRFGSGIEAYLDALFLENHGSWLGHGYPGLMILPASSPYSPFSQDVFLHFPAPGKTD